MTRPTPGGPAADPAPPLVSPTFLRRPDPGRLIAPISRVVTVTAALSVVAVLPWLATGETRRDPALTILRARSAEQEATPEALAAIRRQLGLSDNPLEVLGQWWSGALRGEFGVSWISGTPVLPGTLTALGVSLTLMLCATLVALMTSTLLTAPVLRAGLRGVPGRSSGAGAAAITALPEFLLAAVLLLVGAIWLSLFPPYGWSAPIHLVLPALALGLPAGGLLGRLVGDAAVGAFAEPWVLTWTTAGLPRRTVVAGVLHRCLPGLLPQIGLIMVGLTGGAIAVEQVYAIPGIGRAALGAARAQDLPTLQAGVLVLLGLGVFAGVLGQLARRVMLGPALRTGTVSEPPVKVAGRARSRLVPPIAAGGLIAVFLAGIWRDPFISGHPRLASPDWSRPFGADASGRDVLARVAHGTLSTVGLALAVTLLCFVLGVLAGLLPRVCCGPVEVTNAAPPVIAGILVAAVAGPSAAGAAVAVAVVGWAPLAAHTAALVGEARARPSVTILPVLGVGRTRVLVGAVLPVVLWPVFRHGMLRLPGIALGLAALGFLGLGPAPPHPDWGLLLAEGMNYVERAPWTVLAPLTTLVMLSVLAVALSSSARWRPLRPGR